MMNKYTILSAFTALFMLSGCYTPVMEGAGQAYEAGRRQLLEEDATHRDPVAEYELGNTYCCQGGGPMDKMSVYDNQKATHWYCKAAKQGYGPAQLRLARIYAGHPIQGVNVALRASALLEKADIDASVALMWATVASNNRVADATELRNDLRAHATAKERARADALAKDWRNAPCRWNEVFPQAKSAAEKSVEPHSKRVTGSSER